MKMNTGLWGSIIILLVALCLLPNYTYGKGYEDGKTIGVLEERVQTTMRLRSKNLDHWLNSIPEYKDPMTEDEWTKQLIENLMDGHTTANMTIAFDDLGYTKGNISIYYESK